MILFRAKTGKLDNETDPVGMSIVEVPKEIPTDWLVKNVTGDVYVNVSFIDRKICTKYFFENQEDAVLAKLTFG
jgi:hypothetical protein